MSPRIKKGNPMKYRGFYCSDGLWEEMQQNAIKLDESDSEYIRKAVEQRNAQYNAQLSGEELKKHQEYIAKQNTQVQTFWKDGKK